jgi:ribosomal-protein-alanine N-acetyltransferase
MSAHSEAPTDAETAIDRFRLRDLGAVRRLEKDTFGPHAFDGVTFLCFACSRSHRFLVARDQGQMVGYVVGRQSGWGRRKQGHIVSIAVRGDHRGQGLGAMLLAEVLAQLRDAGVDEVALEVGEANDNAIRLYRRFGFEVDRTLPDFYGPGEHALRMLLTASTDRPTREAE